jgi:ribosomal protein S18 acetylase RimI-like enzyme
MQPARLSSFLCEKGWLWSVAELSRKIVGVIGARVTYLPCSTNAGFADLIGLVVGAEWQGRGIGQRVTRHLDRQIRGVVDWALAETRTAAPGGWKILTRLGYPVIGLEPLCHRTPHGYESMLLQGKISAQRVAARRTSSVSSALAAVAQYVNSQFETDYAFDHYCRDASLVPTQAPAADHRHSEDGTPTTIIPMRQLPTILNRGFVDSRRFIELDIDRSAFVLGGYADMIDRRLYVNSLTRRDGSSSADVVSAALGEALDFAASRSLSSCVLDVRADKTELVEVLTRQGFKPTAYYPGLIRERECTLDAAQFTHMLVKPVLGSAAPITLDPAISRLFDAFNG